MTLGGGKYIDDYLIKCFSILFDTKLVTGISKYIIKSFNLKTNLADAYLIQFVESISMSI